MLYTMFKDVHVRLLAGDFQKTFDFYKNTLGLKPGFVSEGVYADFSLGQTMFGLFSKKLMDAEVAGSPIGDGDNDVLILQVDSVDKTYEKLHSAGVHFVTAPYDKEVWFLRVAHFRDPDGHLIEINEPLKNG